MKKWLPISVVMLVCVLVTGLAGCGGSGGSSQDGDTRLVEVVRDDIRLSVSGSGNIEVDQKINLYFPAGGKVEKIYVEEGSLVKNGEALAQIEQDSLELALSQAEVAYAQAATTLTQAELSKIQADAALVQADVAKSQAELNLEAAIFNRDRMEDVEELQDIIDEADYQIQIAEERLDEANVLENHTAYVYWQSELANAQLKKLEALQDLNELLGKEDYASLAVDDIKLKQLQVQVSEQALEQADKTYESAEKSVQYAGENVELAKQSLEMAELSLANTQKQLDESVIRAPFDGMVAAINGEEGDYILSTAMMSSPFIVFIEPTTMKLVVEVDEIDIPLVELGQKALISVDALEDEEFTGEVTAIAPLSISKSGVILYEVEVSFTADQDSGLKVGMSATADLISDERTDVLIVPIRAVQKDEQGNPFVKVSLDGKTEERQVVVGIYDDFSVEIVSGLSEGETVVVETLTRSSGTSFF